MNAEAIEARNLLIAVARKRGCTTERKLYDALAAQFGWPARDDGVKWRDERLYPVLREMSDQQRVLNEPMLWSLVLADPEDNAR